MNICVGWKLLLMIGIAMLVRIEPLQAQSDAAAKVLFEKALLIETGDRDLEKAIEKYREVLDLTPNDELLRMKTHLRLGVCYERLGQVDNARAMYETILTNRAQSTEEILQIAQNNLDRLSSRGSRRKNDKDHWFRVSFLGGTKRLDTSDWGDLRKNENFGVDLSINTHQKYISLLFGFRTSSSKVSKLTCQTFGFSQPFTVCNTSNLEVKTQELTLGPRISKPIKKILHLYVGFGPGYFHVNGDDFENTQAGSQTEQNIGYYAETGLIIDLTTNLHVGYQFRYSSAKVDMFQVKERSIGGLQSMASFGIRW